MNVPNAAQALRGPLRRFLQRPDPVGIWLHVEDLGVDVTLHVAHERPGAYHWTCSCGHEAARSRPVTQPGDVHRCSLCSAEAPKAPPFRGDATFRTYRWSVRWPRPGKEGLGVGATIEEGAFDDDRLVRGLGDLHHVLTHGVQELERNALQTMEDYRTLQRMRRDGRSERAWA